jgi:hypothetical protein
MGMATISDSGIEIQKRDLEILEGLFECRVMSLKHITDLYFDGKPEAAKKRLQKLKTSGYVKERARRVGDPSLLHLTKKAFAALHQNGHLQQYPNISSSLLEKRTQVSELTLQHELQVLDVKTAVSTAIALHPNLSLSEFSTWPTLFQFNARLNGNGWGRKETVVKPDGFIRIQEETSEGKFEHMFFLELDRSTESNEVLAQKAACYLDFYKSGGMAVRFGGEREDYKDYPFRVLMICKNDERRNNIAERLLQNYPPVLTQVWLSTLAETLTAPLGKIWMRPKDYLAITHGTRFDPENRRNTSTYFRQQERERLVASRIRKIDILNYQ